MKLAHRFFALALCLLAANLNAAEKRGIKDIDTAELTQELKRVSNDAGVQVAWWMPSEFWAVALGNEKSLTPAQTEEVMKILRKYTFLAVVDGRLDRCVSPCPLSGEGSLRFGRRVVAASEDLPRLGVGEWSPDRTEPVHLRQPGKAKPAAPAWRPRRLPSLGTAGPRLCGCAGEARQASRSVPLHTASTTKNRTTGGSTQASSSTVSTVRTALSGVPNRLARHQPIRPGEANAFQRAPAGE